MPYRQKPVGNYITDFFVQKALLVVEVDGVDNILMKGTATRSNA
jgi:very-short-patch-repair endonuclease